MDQNLAQWQQAYLAQRPDATIGRLFKGILHNLNGVIQALSMQVELLELGFERALEFVDAIDAGGEPASCGELRQLLERRRELVGQILDRVQAVCEIISLADLLQQEEGGGDLTKEVQFAVRFMTADRFFKHQVEKEIDVAPGLRVGMASSSLRFVLQVLLENACEAMVVVGERGRLVVRAMTRGDTVELAVEDSGPDPGPLDEHLLFAPFVSSKPGHAGLGLYFARQLVEEAGGSITATRLPDRTRVLVRLPAA